MVKIFTLLSLLAAIIIPSVSQSNLNVTKNQPKRKLFYFNKRINKWD